MRRAHFNKLLALCASTFALASHPSLAEDECACLWAGSFVDVQADTDVVLAATVASAKGNAIDLEIEEALRGDPYFDTIRVWLKTGDYCRPDVEEFPVGSRWVFALNRIREVPEGGFDPGTPNLSFGRIDDYFLSSCGGYWLNYSGEAVTGNLVDAPRWAREPEMTPVLIDLLRSHLRGNTDAAALRKASQEDPALTDLMLDTKAFLRGNPLEETP